ncbi:MAG: hypothetical protein KJO85_09170 [Gammaproteobacteria bacterium]|nr:hypothetical protein [Gammaproteobacteria bacterium]
MFAWIAVATGLILLIPLIAMQFTTEVNWDAPDFLVAGLLLLGAGSLFVLSSRMVPSKHRLVLGVVFAVAVAYIWAELAVGVFTNLGS